MTKGYGELLTWCPCVFLLLQYAAFVNGHPLSGAAPKDPRSARASGKEEPVPVLEVGHAETDKVRLAESQPTDYVTSPSTAAPLPAAHGTSMGTEQHHVSNNASAYATATESAQASNPGSATSVSQLPMALTVTFLSSTPEVHNKVFGLNMSMPVLAGVACGAAIVFLVGIIALLMHRYRRRRRRRIAEDALKAATTTSEAAAVALTPDDGAHKMVIRTGSHSPTSHIPSHSSAGLRNSNGTIATLTSFSSEYSPASSHDGVVGDFYTSTPSLSQRHTAVTGSMTSLFNASQALQRMPSSTVEEHRSEYEDDELVVSPPDSLKDTLQRFSFTSENGWADAEVQRAGTRRSGRIRTPTMLSRKKFPAGRRHSVDNPLGIIDGWGSSTANESELQDLAEMARCSPLKLRPGNWIRNRYGVSCEDAAVDYESGATGVDFLQEDAFTYQSVGKTLQNDILMSDGRDDGSTRAVANWHTAVQRLGVAGGFDRHPRPPLMTASCIQLVGSGGSSVGRHVKAHTCDIVSQVPLEEDCYATMSGFNSSYGARSFGGMDDTGDTNADDEEEEDEDFGGIYDEVCSDRITQVGKRRICGSPHVCRAMSIAVMTGYEGDSSVGGGSGAAQGMNGSGALSVATSIGQSSWNSSSGRLNIHGLDVPNAGMDNAGYMDLNSLPLDLASPLPTPGVRQSHLSLKNGFSMSSLPPKSGLSVASVTIKSPVLAKHATPVDEAGCKIPAERLSGLGSSSDWRQSVKSLHSFWPGPADETSSQKSGRDAELAYSVYGVTRHSTANRSIMPARCNSPYAESVDCLPEVCQEPHAPQYPANGGHRRRFSASAESDYDASYAPMPLSIGNASRAKLSRYCETGDGEYDTSYVVTGMSQHTMASAGTRKPRTISESTDDIEYDTPRPLRSSYGRAHHKSGRRQAISESGDDSDDDDMYDSVRQVSGAGKSHARQRTIAESVGDDGVYDAAYKGFISVPRNSIVTSYNHTGSRRTISESADDSDDYCMYGAVVQTSGAGDNDAKRGMLAESTGEGVYDEAYDNVAVMPQNSMGSDSDTVPPFSNSRTAMNTNMVGRRLSKQLISSALSDGDYSLSSSPTAGPLPRIVLSSSAPGEGEKVPVEPGDATASMMGKKLQQLSAAHDGRAANLAPFGIQSSNEMYTRVSDDFERGVRQTEDMAATNRTLLPPVHFHATNWQETMKLNRSGGEGTPAILALPPNNSDYAALVGSDQQQNFAMGMRTGAVSHNLSPDERDEYVAMRRRSEDILAIDLKMAAEGI